MFQKWKINFFLLFSEAPSFLKTEVISPIWTMYNANLNPIFKYMQFTELLQRFGPIKIMVLSSDQFSHSAMSSSLQLHGLQHARPPCPSPTPRVYSSLCPLSRWCHPTISSSVVPFSSCPQSFPASGSLQMRQLFAQVAKVLEFQL